MTYENLTFIIGSTNGSTACVDIPIINDTDVECDDVFSVKLNSSDTAMISLFSGKESSTVTIEMDSSDC